MYYKQSILYRIALLSLTMGTALLLTLLVKVGSHYQELFSLLVSAICFVLFIWIHPEYEMQPQVETPLECGQIWEYGTTTGFKNGRLRKIIKIESDRVFFEEEIAGEKLQFMLSINTFRYNATLIKTDLEPQKFN